MEKGIFILELKKNKRIILQHLIKNLEHMKRVLLFFIAIAFVSASFAQDADTLKPWKIYGVTSLTINQSSFTNWSAGGDNAFSGMAMLKFYADYAKGKNSVTNVLNLKYGMIKTGDDPVEKNEDLIELISQYNNQFAEKWAASVQLNFTSQFAKGYESAGDEDYISKFLAPGYLTISPGISYTPVDYFSILISPITAQTTFVTDQGLADLGAFGVNPATYDTSGVKLTDGENSKFKFGAMVEFYLKKEISTDFAIESRLNVFYNYLQDDNIDALKDAGENVVPVYANWQTFLNYKFNDWLSANFFIHFAYMPTDIILSTDDAGEQISTPNNKIQIKQTLGIGLAYNF